MRATIIAKATGKIGGLLSRLRTGIERPHPATGSDAQRPAIPGDPAPAAAGVERLRARPLPVECLSPVVPARTRVGALVTALVFRLDDLPSGTPVQVLDAGGWGDTAVAADRERLAQLVVTVLEHLGGAPRDARAFVDFAPAEAAGHAVLRVGLHASPPRAPADVTSVEWAVARRIAVLHGGVLTAEGAGQATLLLPILRPGEERLS